MRTIVLLAAAVATAWPQSLEEAGTRLAERISKALPGANFKILVENRSDLPDSLAERLRMVLDRELRPKSDGQVVRFTVAQNLRQSLLVATVTAENDQVLIEPFAAPSTIADLRMKLVLQSVTSETRRILDFTIQQSRLIVLFAGEVAVYERQLDRWSQSRTVTFAAPPLRDPRGRLRVTGERIQVYLPGVTCFADFPLVSVECKSESASWMEGGLHLAWLPGRNSLVSPEFAGESFYSSVRVDPKTTLRTMLDGTLRGVKSGRIGSDIAPIASACASTPLILITSASTDPDNLQAVESNSGELRPVTDRLALSGPVVALWQDGAEASIVVRDRLSDKYEASRVSLNCSH